MFVLDLLLPGVAAARSYAVGLVLMSSTFVWSVCFAAIVAAAVAVLLFEVVAVAELWLPMSSSQDQADQPQLS